jgi:endonuclease/exonuclease/phosphatase family metal-dependent hydrolase
MSQRFNNFRGACSRHRDRALGLAMTADRPLRVATYNIHKGVGGELFGLPRAATVHELRRRLHELNADLIFLQEVQGRHDRHARRVPHWPAESQELFLARSPLGARGANLRPIFESAYGRNASYLHGHHGNALLSRFPILRRAHLDVSDHVMERRGVLHCAVALAGREVHCFVIHLSLLGASRERQVAALIDWIRVKVGPAEPLLIAGDFNDWRHRLSDTLGQALGVQECGSDQPSGSAARTFPSVMPWLRLDRIYQRGFAVDQVQVLRGLAWSRLSDHSPLVADLRPLVTALPV